MVKCPMQDTTADPEWADRPVLRSCHRMAGDPLILENKHLRRARLIDETVG